MNWEKCRSAAQSFKKFQFPISFMNWEKLRSIHCLRASFQNLNFEYMDELEKVIF